MKIGNTLKLLRKSKNLTQKQLAQKLDVTATTITRYENDDREPNIEMITKISKALEVPVTDILYPTDEDKEGAIKEVQNTLKYEFYDKPAIEALSFFAGQIKINTLKEFLQEKLENGEIKDKYLEDWVSYITNCIQYKTYITMENKDKDK